MTMGVSEPHVTVIVPSFNQARYVRDALDSIEHASDRPVHVHVVDGASTDGTVEILREYESMPRMTWTSRPDRGVHDAVNDGLRAARTPYCLVLSTDDALLPGSLDEGVEILLAEPQLAMVFGDAEYIDAAGRSQGIARAREACLGSLLAKSTFVIQGSALFRTERARLVGDFVLIVPTCATASFGFAWRSSGQFGTCRAFGPGTDIIRSSATRSASASCKSGGSLSISCAQSCLGACGCGRG